jgi:hypothetical protein
VYRFGIQLVIEVVDSLLMALAVNLVESGHHVAKLVGAHPVLAFQTMALSAACLMFRTGSVD